MPMQFEISAVDFQFNKHQLPLSRRHFSLGLAILKQQDHAGFIGSACAITGALLFCLEKIVRAAFFS
jgi:hypothetical protein